MNLVSASQRISKSFPTAKVSVACSSCTEFDNIVIALVVDYNGCRFIDSLSIKCEEVRETSPSKLELRLARKVNEFINRIAGGQNAASIN